jgi:hypothetical protein
MGQNASGMDGEEEGASRFKKFVDGRNLSWSRLVGVQLTRAAPQTWYNTNPLGNGSGAAIAQIQLMHAATLHGY